jgi:hypothetical protein
MQQDGVPRRSLRTRSHPMRALLFAGFLFFYTFLDFFWWMR